MGNDGPYDNVISTAGSPFNKANADHLMDVWRRLLPIRGRCER